MSFAQRNVHHEDIPNHALAAGLAGFRAARVTPESSPADTITLPVEAEDPSPAPSSAVEALHVVPPVDSTNPSSAPDSPSRVSEERLGSHGAPEVRPQERTRKQKPSYPAHCGSGRVDKAVSSAPQPARAPQQFEDMPLRSLRFVDLCARVAMQKESGITCRFILRDGNSTAVFTLSVVPTNRVRFTCRESTVSFAPIFLVGSELFQDEIWKMREPSPERAMATEVFQNVLEAIDVRMTERRNERSQGSHGRPQGR